MKKITLSPILAFLLLLMGCTTKKLIVNDSHMTLDEVVYFTDSISKLYYVDSKLNLDYIKEHPISYTNRKKLEDKIIYASPVYNWVTVTDSIGEFRRITDFTEEQKHHIEVMKDSITYNRFCTHGGIMGSIELFEGHDLVYDIAYYQLRTEEPKVLHCDVKVVNKTANDTIRVEAKNHRFSVLSNPPLVLACVFEVDYGGHTFVFHEIKDIRTMSNKEKTEIQYTRECYQIK